MEFTQEEILEMQEALENVVDWTQCSTDSEHSKMQAESLLEKAYEIIVKNNKKI